MRALTLSEIIQLHRMVVAASGGAGGIRDLGALESAVAQPHATFDGIGLYPSVLEKAAALCFAIVCNHPFVDGNKRAGHAALETFLVLNGYELVATVSEQEQVFLSLASGNFTRESLVRWVEAHVFARSRPT